MSYKNTTLYTKYKQENKNIELLQILEKTIGCKETARDIANQSILYIVNQITDSIKLFYFVSQSENLEGFITFKGDLLHSDFPKFNPALKSLSFNQDELDSLKTNPTSFKKTLKRKLEEYVNNNIEFLRTESDTVISMYR